MEVDRIITIYKCSCGNRGSYEKIKKCEEKHKTTHIVEKAGLVIGSKIYHPDDKQEEEVSYINDKFVILKGEFAGKPKYNSYTYEEIAKFLERNIKARNEVLIDPDIQGGGL